MKKKVLFGLLVAAGAAFLAYKALKPHVEVTIGNDEATAPTPDDKAAEKQDVDIEEVVAYVTTPSDVASDAVAEEPVVDAQPDVASEEDFVADDNA